MSRGRSDVLMALDADPGVEAVASQPMRLHWVSESGKARRHAPDFFARRADGTGVLIDVRHFAGNSSRPASAVALTGIRPYGQPANMLRGGPA